MLACGSWLVPVALADSTVLPAFSEIQSLDPSSSWEPLEFPKIDQHSRYELVTESGVQVIRAQTAGGASGLIARLDLTPSDSLILSWRWKVSNVFEKGDAREKSGDDYPARIYVAFAFEPDKAGFFERAKRKAVEVVFGETLPGNALNYIWANALPKGDIVPNPYTDKTMMVAVNSGTGQVGEWVTVERDIVADYRKAFGEAPPPLVGIAIMSDSDNTGETATAWYGDISLSAGILPSDATGISRENPE
ncbi:hypothetical protein BKP64_15455 [Marinobacter salinus]|uniref:DUF3047 domain-containing protein n=1 Tax=Marinobacter salinus TaxID=1874317 RepID=A0A1D9GRQ3_9GAMM|nr:DUF3047 domain-containing protein [Marinobacter salinus]AOY90317.1 hypothetical protein BKP64_15455 [Marinobacter salinus]